MNILRFVSFSLTCCVLLICFDESNQKLKNYYPSLIFLIKISQKDIFLHVFILFQKLRVMIIIFYFFGFLSSRLTSNLQKINVKLTNKKKYQIKEKVEMTFSQILESSNILKD